MRNRRNYERFGSDMIFWMKAHGSNEELQPFQVENISAGGILIDTTARFAEGTIVQLEFELPQHSDLLHAKAVVRHLEPAENESFQVGLEFLDVDELRDSQLTRYLEELFK